MRRLMIYLGCLGLATGNSLVFSADPQLPFWSGRLAEKTKPALATQTAGDKPAAKPAADAKAAADKSPEKPTTPPEPEWLRQLDKNDRSTITGGWGLQNLSGGKSSLTTAGDRSGYYAPNTYQGGQFQSWNNVSNRQDVPSWNGSTPGFPSGMWSQGYTSPNNYFGADAQRWGNMSSGGLSPNTVSGGWSMSPWP